MPPRLNSKQFQNKVIAFIGERLGIHAYASFEGYNQKTQSNSVNAVVVVLFPKILVCTSREETI